MAQRILENGVSFGENRQKINDNFTELYAGVMPDAPANGKLHGRIDNAWKEIPSTSADLMFFAIENGNPVATHTAPTEPQTIMPITHFPASPGVWHDILTFTIGEDLHETEFEFIPGNSFMAKFWIRSDMARSNAQFRLTATNIQTGAALARGTAEIDLGQTGELQPLPIFGLYEIPAVVPAENIRMTLQVLSPLFGVQIGLFSIPPDEIAYIARLVSGLAIPGLLDQSAELSLATAIQRADAAQAKADANEAGIAELRVLIESLTP